MSNSTQANMQFQHRLMPQVIDILRRNAGHMLAFRLADKIEDTKQSTDIVLEAENKLQIAVRVRRASINRRDFTVRAQVRGGGKTEIHKLREGWGHWYLYAWEHEGRLAEWMLINLATWRDSGMATQERKLIPNKYPNGTLDGTGFYAYSVDELKAAQALTAAVITKDGYHVYEMRSYPAVDFSFPTHLKGA